MTEIHSYEFWRRQFPSRVELSRLPFDRPSPPVPSYLRDRVELVLEDSVKDRVQELGNRLNVLSFAIVLAAVQSVLFHYGSQESSVIGVEVKGGSAARAKFVPIRTDWSVASKLSGCDLIFHLAGALTEAEAHADYPLEAIQSWAGTCNQSNGPRLFNVALCEIQDNDMVTSELLAQCDVVITYMFSAAGTMLQAEFDAELFEPETVSRLLGHIATLLQGMIGDLSKPVLQLAMLTESEKRQLLGQYEAHTETEGSASVLHKRFEAHVKRTPDAIALTCEGHSLTYRELNLKANRIAHHLVEVGVKPDTLVGLCVDRSNELVIALLSIIKSGGAYLPIDLAYPPDRVAFMLEDAHAPVLLTERKFRGKLPATSAVVLYVEDLLQSQAELPDDVNPSTGVLPDNLAYVIYTSGTTGTPKGSLITHRNVSRLFSATEQWYGFDDRDVWTLFHSTAFDFSVWEIWGAWIYGGKVVVVPFMVSRSPEAFYELLAKEQVTVLNQTPSAFRQLIRAEETVESKALALRYVIFGGEALELQSLKPWFDRHGDVQPRLVNMYGITETTVHVTYRPLSENDVESGSVIGVPIPDLQLHILNEYRQLVPIGIPGEMYVGGEGLARGYLNRPELTAERFVTDTITGQSGKRLYRTGDLARRLPDGDIEYLGRIDHQVKIRGFRIELGEIESVLCQHPSVRETVVMAREDEIGIKRLVSYVVSSAAVPDAGELREHLKRKLPDYMVPAAIVFLDKFPLTASGKIDRKALPVPESDRRRPVGTTGGTALPSDLERRLASIWSKALGLDKVGVEENFFELGGDSILIVQVHRQLREQLQIELPIVALFEYPTIRALARHFSESATPTNDAESQVRDRASRQKEVLAQMKARHAAK